MKLLLMLAFFLSIQAKSPGKEDAKKEEPKKTTAKSKKTAKASFRLTPSVLIVHF